MYDLEQLPDHATRGLAALVQVHRDIDEEPIHFRYAYVFGTAERAELQHAYHDAVEAVRQWLASLDGAAIEAAEAECGVLNGEAALPPRVRSYLAGCQPRLTQIAHAVTGRWIQLRYYDITPALVADLPAESRLLRLYPELRGAFTPRDFLLPVGGKVTPG